MEGKRVYTNELYVLFFVPKYRQQEITMSEQYSLCKDSL